MPTKLVELLLTVQVDDPVDLSASDPAAADWKHELPVHVGRSILRLLESETLKGEILAQLPGGLAQRQWSGKVLKAEVPARGILNPKENADILQELSDLREHNAALKTVILDVVKVVSRAFPA